MLLNSDIFHSHPLSLKYAKDFSKARQDAIDKGSKKAWPRLKVFESYPGLEGPKADERQALRPEELQELAFDLLNLARGEKEAPTSLAKNTFSWLKETEGALISIGHGLFPKAKEIEQEINHELGSNSARYVRSPIEGDLSADQVGELAQKGEITHAFFLETDPFYWRPDLASKLKNISFKFALSLFPCDTTQNCDVICPAKHHWESWSDLASLDWNPDNCAAPDKAFIQSANR